jgi:hypothetical protein
LVDALQSAGKRRWAYVALQRAVAAGDEGVELGTCVGGHPAGFAAALLSLFAVNVHRAVSEGLLRKIASETSVLTLEAGLAVMVAALATPAVAAKVQWRHHLVARHPYHAACVVNVLLPHCCCAAGQLSGCAGSVVPLLIAKCFNNTKTKVVDMAQEATIRMMEVVLTSYRAARECVGSTERRVLCAQVEGIQVAYDPLVAALRDVKKKRSAVAAGNCLAAAVRVCERACVRADVFRHMVRLSRTSLHVQLKHHKKRVKADDILAILPTLLNHTDGQISACGVDLFLAFRGVYKTQVCAVVLTQSSCCRVGVVIPTLLTARAGQCHDGGC